MPPEEVEQTIQFLEQLAKEHGLNWVLRLAEEGAEQETQSAAPDARVRLVFMINGLIQVLRESDELERALPELPEETNAEEIVWLEGREQTVAVGTGAASKEDLERTLGALTELRGLVESGR